MARFTFFSSFSMSNFDGFLGGLATNAGAGFPTNDVAAVPSTPDTLTSFIVDRTLVNENTIFNGTFARNLSGEYGGSIRSFSSGPLFDPNDANNAAISIRVAGTNLNAGFRDFQDAQLAGDPLLVFAVLADDDDVMVASTGADRIFGFAGDDRINGRGGDDTLIGGEGDDRVNGGRGDDRLIGGGGADRIVGAAGADVGKGGAGVDLLLGGGGDDRLIGGGGDDMIRGQRGDDRLIGGGGDDRLGGGAGDDRFVFSANSGADVVLDFAVGSDALIFRGAGAFSDLEISGSTAGAVVGFGSAEVTLNGVAAAVLSESDFIF